MLIRSVASTLLCAWLAASPSQAQPVFIDQFGRPIIGGNAYGQALEMYRRSSDQQASPDEVAQDERERMDRATWIRRQDARRSEERWARDRERFERLHSPTPTAASQAQAELRAFADQQSRKRQQQGPSNPVVVVVNPTTNLLVPGSFGADGTFTASGSPVPLPGASTLFRAPVNSVTSQPVFTPPTLPSVSAAPSIAR